ncbi:class I SAM-dependent methyltransferase [Immundisolibacter sp.]|uniref:class I SAM-dependent methyltransferase n=1 Tax=Immundisolibacter sp. TaxID=1934948 RepID=UPI003568B61C
MSAKVFSEARILESWGRNAAAWTVAVRDRKIDSRVQVTDRAIVEAILSRRPGSVLDLGCGEGWLVRELAARNIEALGVDAVPGLIADAMAAGGGGFLQVSYEDLATGKHGVLVDVIACNFSLLGKESVEDVFRTAPLLLNPHGSLIVQTLHPVFACGDLPYQDGWRAGSWAGFSADFTDPAPWYFRTLDSWVELFVNNGFRLLEVREPLHPHTQTPASVIFIAEPPA